LIALQVEFLTGPNAGRKLMLRDACVTFGRSAERTLPIDLPFVSRQHGEFTFDRGQWLLVNHSNNGTLLNGQPVTHKPRPIKGPSTVTIGEDDVFRVRPIADPDDPKQPHDAHATPATPGITDTHDAINQDPAAHRASNRAKL